VPERIDEQIGAITAIEPKRHFLKIGWKMLCRELVPRTKDASLEQGERGFNPVCGHVAIDINLCAMVDRFVWNILHSRLYNRAGIGWKLIGHDDFDILADVLFDVLRL
jgi:hypothetical protein